MKTAKQAQREARRLFGLCRVNGSIDEERARSIVQTLVESGRSAVLPVLSRFERLIRVDRDKHTADVRSAAPLPPDVKAQLEAAVARAWGPGITLTFATDPALLGGVRITVGSDLVDASVAAGLAALQARF
jgi:F-type H+-transporting ATPase subunit delta